MKKNQIIFNIHIHIHIHIKAKIYKQLKTRYIRKILLDLKKVVYIQKSCHYVMTFMPIFAQFLLPNPILLWPPYFQISTPYFSRRMTHPLFFSHLPILEIQSLYSLTSDIMIELLPKLWYSYSEIKYSCFWCMWMVEKVYSENKKEET